MQARLGGFGVATHIQMVRRAVVLEDELGGDVPGPSAAAIEFKDDSEFRFTAEDAAMVVSAVDTAVQRQKLRRFGTALRMSDLALAASTKFDEGEPAHLAQLSELWTLVFGTSQGPFNVLSAAWELIGFQTERPSTDFRGMGILGLQCIIYFCKHRSAVAAAVLSEGRTYPFAITVLNIAHRVASGCGLRMIKRLLPLADCPSDPPFLSFLSRVRDQGAFGESAGPEEPTPTRDDAFFELTCVAIELFDFLWVTHGAGISNFEKLLNRVIGALEGAVSGPVTTFNAVRANVRSVVASDDTARAHVGAGEDVML